MSAVDPLANDSAIVPDVVRDSKYIKKNPEEEKLEEYAAFDVLRFILASVVMLGHMGVLTWHNSGNLAVQVFFALSGWLIGGILYNTAPRELSRFYFNRSTRVWIPYFFTVFALYLTSLLHEPIRSSRWFEFLGYDLTFTHNWFTLWPDASTALGQMPLGGTGNGFWSLAVEEQFYLVAPLVMTAMPFGKKVLPWVCLSIVSYISGSQYGSICLGVLSAVSARKYVKWYIHEKAIAALVLALGGAVIVTMTEPTAYVFTAPIIAICVVLLCAHPLPRNLATRWLGGISFPFYLNAWIGTFALHRIEKHFAISPSWYTLPLEFLAGMFGAALTYHLIDVPVMANRNRYYRPYLGWLLGGIGYVLIATGILMWLLVPKL